MTILEIQKQANKIAHDKKLWEDGINIPRNLALIHSEVSEALEADRIENFAHLGLKEIGIFVGIQDDDKFKSFFENDCKNTFEDELADILIRTLNLAYEMEIDIETHIKLKMRYNSLRPEKNGKKY